jgi:GTP-binding protein
MIRDYLLKRENLMTVFVLVDVRHDPQKIDVEFINWLGEQGVPFCIVFTKADKLSKQQVIRSVESYKRTLRTTWEELPMLFITSAQMRNGREEILDYILSVAADFKPSRKP